tara:strand:+ start:136 stop:468 length:333 start_codon:yes stop_codon:yes gene_type:complete
MKLIGMIIGLSAVHLVSFDAHAIELCNVPELIETMVGKDGPLEGCQSGDTIHMQINSGLVSPATVSARYCDFSQSIIIEQAPTPNLSHLVCSYDWKWAKHTPRTKHPDYN